MQTPPPITMHQQYSAAGHDMVAFFCFSPATSPSTSSQEGMEALTFEEPPYDPQSPPQYPAYDHPVAPNTNTPPQYPPYDYRQTPPPPYYPPQAVVPYQGLPSLSSSPYSPHSNIPYPPSLGATPEAYPPPPYSSYPSSVHASPPHPLFSLDSAHLHPPSPLPSHTVSPPPLSKRERETPGEAGNHAKAPRASESPVLTPIASPSMSVDREAPRASPNPALSHAITRLRAEMEARDGVWDARVRVVEGGIGQLADTSTRLVSAIGQAGAAGEAAHSEVGRIRQEVRRVVEDLEARIEGEAGRLEGLVEGLERVVGTVEGRVGRAEAALEGVDRLPGAYAQIRLDLKGLEDRLRALESRPQPAPHPPLEPLETALQRLSAKIAVLEAAPPPPQLAYFEDQLLTLESRVNTALSAAALPVSGEISPTPHPPLCSPARIPRGYGLFRGLY